MQAFIGTSGWLYKHWNRRFFPADLPKKDWLAYLSTKFSTVEVNTTFYHMARVSTFEKWKKEVPKGFKFTLKFYRLFTHFKKLKLDKSDMQIMEAFFRNAKVLGTKLGPILVQFPPSFRKDLEKLASFAAQIKKIEKKLGKKFLVAMEFRHMTWFDDEVYEILRKQKFAFVITNSPAWPSKVIKTTDFVYMRFHGRTKLFASNYTKQELRTWARTLRKLHSKQVFAYFNNDANAYAADNALFLQKIIL